MPAAKKPARKQATVTLSDLQAVTVTIGGSPAVAAPRQFSTGSIGWMMNGKVNVIVDGKPVLCQVGMNIIVVGSKPE